MEPTKEQVVSDGLSKKQRRALKVKNKLKETESTQNKKENSPQKTNGECGKQREMVKTVADTNLPKVVKEADKQCEQAPGSKSNAPSQQSPKKEPACENEKKQISPKVKQSSNQTQLSEKERRKLEWEKKLAEEKKQKDASDNKQLSKAELRVIRREQQDAQRMAKTASNTKPAPKPKTEQVLDTEGSKSALPARPALSKVAESLPVFDNDDLDFENVHPAFVRLGVGYATRQILGSNARCLGLLHALKCLVEDLEVSPEHDFPRYLESIIQPCINHIENSRPMSVSMKNSLKHFKTKVHESDSYTDEQKKGYLIESINGFVNDHINKAAIAISLHAREKIEDGDVILTYGCSTLVKRLFSDAYKSQKKFTVILTDGGPLYEGQQMLQFLNDEKIPCIYCPFSSIFGVMKWTTKIFLGAHALLTNGSVMSRVGTTSVALVGQYYNKAVLVCCETYKFSAQAHEGSLACDELVQSSNSSSKKLNQAAKRKNEYLTVANHLYDLTPPELISGIVTELSILPCISVPVVLRMKP